MKNIALIYLSLTVSIVALGYAAWVYQHAGQLAEQALQKRERQFVQTFAPKVQEVYHSLGVTNVVANPTTLDELFGPYLETINRFMGPPAKDEKKIP